MAQWDRWNKSLLFLWSEIDIVLDMDGLILGIDLLHLILLVCCCDNVVILFLNIFW